MNSFSLFPSTKRRGQFSIEQRQREKEEKSSFYGLFFWAYFFARQIFLLLEMTKGQGDDPLGGCMRTPQGKACHQKVLYLLLENKVRVLCRHTQNFVTL
jgi:hypothetical protein